MKHFIIIFIYFLISFNASAQEEIFESNSRLVEILSQSGSYIKTEEINLEPIKMIKLGESIQLSTTIYIYTDMSNGKKYAALNMYNSSFSNYLDMDEISDAINILEDMDKHIINGAPNKSISYRYISRDNMYIVAYSTKSKWKMKMGSLSYVIKDKKGFDLKAQSQSHINIPIDMLKSIIDKLKEAKDVISRNIM